MVNKVAMAARAARETAAAVAGAIGGVATAAVGAPGGAAMATVGAARGTAVAAVGAAGGVAGGEGGKGGKGGRGGTAHPRPERMITAGLHHGWARGGEEVERGISNMKWRFGMKMGRWRFI